MKAGQMEGWQEGKNAPWVERMTDGRMEREMRSGRMAAGKDTRKEGRTDRCMK